MERLPSQGDDLLDWMIGSPLGLAPPGDSSAPGLRGTAGEELLSGLISLPGQDSFYHELLGSLPKRRAELCEEAAVQHVPHGDPTGHLRAAADQAHAGLLVASPFPRPTLAHSLSSPAGFADIDAPREDGTLPPMLPRVRSGPALASSLADTFSDWADSSSPLHSPLTLGFLGGTVAAEDTFAAKSFAHSIAASGTLASLPTVQIKPHTMVFLSASPRHQEKKASGKTAHREMTRCRTQGCPHRSHVMCPTCTGFGPEQLTADAAPEKVRAIVSYCRSCARKVNHVYPIYISPRARRRPSTGLATPAPPSYLSAPSDVRPQQHSAALSLALEDVDKSREKRTERKRRCADALDDGEETLSEPSEQNQ